MFHEWQLAIHYIQDQPLIESPVTITWPLWLPHKLTVAHSSFMVLENVYATSAS